MARGVAVAGNGDAENVRWEGVGTHALGPLDHDYRALVGEEFVEIDGVRGTRALVETVQVKMIELEPSAVRVHECE